MKPRFATVCFGTIVTALLSAALAAAWDGQANACAGGNCPSTFTGDGNARPSNAPLTVDTRAIVRIANAQAGSRVLGTGTLIETDAERGLIVTCAHLFREGAGTLIVTFSNGQSFAARLLKVDSAADLAALEIKTPAVQPAKIAAQFPRPGEPLVSCGYGSDGQLWCNQGQALGYVTTSGGRESETLELTGAARFGDSGGPVLDRNQQLVAVLFGTNGRVVDGTFCGRVRRFLSGLSPRGNVAKPNAPGAPSAGPVDVTPPLVQVPPPPSAGPAGAERMARLEQIVWKINDAWQAMTQRIDALASAAEQAGSPATAPDTAPTSPSTSAPQVELPSNMDSTSPAAEQLESLAEPWLSARLTALLVSLGVPGGVAGVAAGAAVWFVMRRAKARLQSQLDQLKTNTASNSATSGTAASTDASAATPQVLHQNRYVPYENNVLDKAWADAHAILVEKYPGFRPALEAAQRLKNQLLAGIPPQNLES